MRVTKDEKRLVNILSFVVGGLLFISVLIVGTTYLTSIGVRVDDIPVLAVVAAILPSATVSFLDRRWRTAIDTNIPFLVKEISEGGKSGLTLERSIDVASARRYGPLTRELRTIVAQMSWGISLEKALESFAERVETLLVRRTVNLLIETSRAGGDVQEILESIYEHVNNLAILDKERRSRLRPYVSISYIAFIIFIIVGILLFKTFFMQLNEAWKGLARGFVVKSIDLPAITTVFYHMSMIQAFFGGIVAGKTSEGLVRAGLKHSLILMLLGFLVFHFLVW